MTGYPAALVAIDHVEPVPRRIRATAGGRTVLDTTSARYVWEQPHYPQYYVPLDDVAAGVLVDEQQPRQRSRGTARPHALVVGDRRVRCAAQVYGADALEPLRGTARFEWSALDAWFEEDEQVFVHPRSPYVRVDALRSVRSVRVEVEGVAVAETSSPVLVFETGLPTRYYLPRTDVDFEHLVATETVTECPYKGTTSGYWSVRVAGVTHPDLAWAYDFPTRQLLPIAGMVAFFNDRVDHVVGGTLLARPAAQS